jgi:hypothetical protein
MRNPFANRVVGRAVGAVTAADIVGCVRITDLAEALGIKLDRTRRRGVASWRKGRNFSVSFCDAKNVWHDFATGEGGGLVDFVVRVRVCDRQTALQWLADFAGVPLGEQTDAERRAWVRRMREAEPEAKKLVAWKFETLRALREQRDHLFRIYHRAKHFILNHDVGQCEAAGDLRFELALSVGWSYWSRIRALDQQIVRLEAANYADLLARFRGGAVS